MTGRQTFNNTFDVDKARWPFNVKAHALVFFSSSSSQGILSLTRERKRFNKKQQRIDVKYSLERRSHFIAA